MKLLRRIFTIVCLVALASAIYGAVYARKYGFSSSWRRGIENEVEKRGYFVEIGKLTLGPFRGLVAEDVEFFQSDKREQTIAVVDDVYLDLDLSRIFDNKQISINTLDIQEAKLSLPLEPGNPESKSKLNIEKVSGRIVVTESQIEVVRAQAEIEDVEISIKGSLYRPEEMTELFLKSDQSDDERRLELEQIALRRKQVKGFLKEIKRIAYVVPDEKPRLEIDFRSDLGNMDGLRANARLKVPNFKIDSYEVESLDVKAEYDGEQNKGFLNELKLVDSKGELRIDGEWDGDSNEVEFAMSSTADLTQLATVVMRNQRNLIGEIVFFSPPHVEMEGVLRLNEFAQLEDEEAPMFWIPAQLIGNVRCDRFVSKGGEVFDGMEFDFSASGDRVYLRNARLDHKTGLMQANVIYDASSGDDAFQYQSEIKMDPRPFVPFFQDVDARDFLGAWDFGKNSTVYVAAVGQGPTLDSKTWTSSGIVDLRNFKLNGALYDELEARYELDGYVQVYRDVRLANPEKTINAEEVIFDARSNIWKLPREMAQLKLFEGAEVFLNDKAPPEEPTSEEVEENSGNQ